MESRRKEREWVQFHNVVCRDMLRLQPLSHKLSSSLFKKFSFPSEALFLISRCIVTYQTRRGWTSQNPCFLCTYVLLSDSLYLAPLTSSGGERAGVRNRTLQEFLKYCSSMLIWREGARTYKQGKEEGILITLHVVPSADLYKCPNVCVWEKERGRPLVSALFHPLPAKNISAQGHGGSFNNEKQEQTLFEDLRQAYEYRKGENFLKM